MSSHVCLITGAASGIGLATARAFAARGDAVAIADVNDITGQEAAQALRDTGNRAIFVPLDVAERTAWTRAVEQTTQELGPIDVLVNNAGIIRDRSLLKMTDAQWDLVINVNLRGAFLGAQTVFPAMKAKGWGRIVNVSSSAHRGGFGQANYASAKAGLVGLTRTLAIEGIKNGILVNAIAPHNVNTAILSAVPEDIKAEWLRKSRLGRFAEPAEIAAVIRFLASDENTIVSGQLIEADGTDLVGAG